jgi:hypothetical protein
MSRWLVKKHYARAIHEVRVARPELGEEQPTLLFRLMMPWLSEPEGENRDQIAKGAMAQRSPETFEIFLRVTNILFNAVAMRVHACPHVRAHSKR